MNSTGPLLLVIVVVLILVSDTISRTRRSTRTIAMKLAIIEP
jgi:hypothetical protein